MIKTPRISIIVACTLNLAIGKNGDLLYHLREDLKRFKSLTMGCPLIMGRKTFESLPGGALPGRRNIVITRNRDFMAKDAEVANSLIEAIEMVGGAQRAFVIGGGEVYRQALEVASDIEMTLLDVTVDDADTFFPPLYPNVWQLPSGFPENVDFDMTDARSSVRYAFLTIPRIKF